MRIVYLTLTVFICLNFTLTAQTVLKPQPLSSLTYHSTTLSLDDTTIWALRTQQHFMMGWQWAGFLCQ
jgi:hypothetical protein